MKKFPKNHELGLEWRNDQGELCRTVERFHASGKRIARLVESTWTGISIGAIHYYAEIRVHSPNWSVNGDGCGHGGYGGKNRPEIRGIDLEAERILTKFEKDANGEPLGKIGDSTRRFNHPKEARAAAVKLFKASFGRGWILLLETMTEDDKNEIVATT